MYIYIYIYMLHIHVGSPCRRPGALSARSPPATVGLGSLQTYVQLVLFSVCNTYIYIYIYIYVFLLFSFFLKSQ